MRVWLEWRSVSRSNLQCLCRTSKSSPCGGSGNKQQSANSSGSAANDSVVPMTSCGNSPGSAEPSPHGNATGLSQQSLPSEVSDMSFVA